VSITAVAATGLSSLSDQTVSAPTDCPLRLSFGTDDHEDEDSGIRDVQLSYPPWAVAASSKPRTVV
jgi:hypothetical protein